MSEENPYYFYDNYPKEDLETLLKKKMFEMDSYKRWTERALEEVKYIQNVLEWRKKE